MHGSSDTGETQVGKHQWNILSLNLANWAPSFLGNFAKSHNLLPRPVTINAFAGQYIVPHIIGIIIIVI